MVFPRALGLGPIHVLEANCMFSSISMKNVCDIYHSSTLVQYIPGFSYCNWPWIMIHVRGNVCSFIHFNVKYMAYILLFDIDIICVITQHPTMVGKMILCGKGHFGITKKGVEFNELVTTAILKPKI
jgi:hypothetical protein